MEWILLNILVSPVYLLWPNRVRSYPATIFGLLAWGLTLGFLILNTPLIPLNLVLLATNLGIASFSSITAQLFIACYELNELNIDVYPENKDTLFKNWLSRLALLGIPMMLFAAALTNYLFKFILLPYSLPIQVSLLIMTLTTPLLISFTINITRLPDRGKGKESPYFLVRLANYFVYLLNGKIFKLTCRPEPEKYQSKLTPTYSHILSLDEEENSLIKPDSPKDESENNPRLAPSSATTKDTHCDKTPPNSPTDFSGYQREASTLLPLGDTEETDFNPDDHEVTESDYLTSPS